MKVFASFCAAAITVMAATGCSSKQQSDNATTDGNKSNTLVLYYSQTGTTKALADSLASMLNADIEAIELVDPYPADYNATIQRCLKERETDSIPAFKPINADLASYDVIFLGYPIWFGTYARPIISLVSNNDFADKTIVPFCTFGSGGLEASAADLKAALPKAKIAEGFGLRTARIADIATDLPVFLAENGYIDGPTEAQPAFSDEQPVNEQDTVIFNQACGNYTFPLGTPVAASKRTTYKGTEYKYSVNSKGPDGADAKSTIYVIVPNDTTQQPYFTRVVR